MANDLLEDDQEMVDETPNNLKDFHMSELLELIENTINNEEYDIELFIRKIHDFWKGTKAEPFLVKLKEYFENKYNPTQTISKIVKKFG